MLPIPDANTPLSPEEQADLIPSLATHEELNEWERDNILTARRWVLGGRQLDRLDPFSENYLRELHRRMFGQTWRWAGTYRKSDRNLGVPVAEIQERIAQLLGDAKYWLENGTYDVDETAVRFHYELVAIHAFPNGNGRHARLIADFVGAKYGRQVFSWGSKDLVSAGEAREAYLSALRTADKREIADLVKFARS